MLRLAALVLLASAAPCRAAGSEEAAAAELVHQARLVKPGRPQGAWEWLADRDLAGGVYHQRHVELFGKYALGFNRFVLEAVDRVQGHAMDGGGYFTGVKASPPESPIGYALALFGKSLLVPPRATSFCTGASYSAFIEALDLIFAGHPPALTPERLEAMRLQEPDGGRREDHVKFWGHWNADNTGDDYALVQYSRMGVVVPPEQARAGDFMNILWKTGASHSTVFLGWRRSKEGPQLLVWSSQKDTNGLGDYLVPTSRVAGVKVVRLSRPEALADFDVNAPVDPAPSWDRLPWTEPPRRHSRRSAGR